MNTLNKKLFRNIILASISLFIVGYLSITLIKNIGFSNVKQEVLDSNPEINSIVSINRLGQWGEPVREYVLEVKKGTTTYRVWTSPNGVITDEEIISN
ncbi:hypothetical protein [Pontibacillus yanchengensis]|uniref:Uncharacterized protein n=1 Tax=Pontibacillus yanchengensis Y32 TaxID=1385514 RepID=A0A0A2T8F5_9BACI|nr:hypothetical protein [Pontibacillus yanchengensis]KGP72102.1 hypothetical protein N782_14065 [Pontibacillus yanchengensis Y32]